MEQAVIDEILRRVPGLDVGEITRNIAAQEPRTLKTLECYSTEDDLRDGIQVQTKQLYQQTNRGSLTLLQRGMIHYYIILFERKIDQLHTAAAAVQAQMQQEADKRALQIGQAIATKTIEVYEPVIADLLAKEAEERDRKEKERLEKERLEREEKHRQEQEQQRLDDERRKSEREHYEQIIRDQDKVISELKNARDIKSLADDYMRLAQQNQYFLELIKTISNPLDSILIHASLEGDMANVKAAVRLGADVNSQDVRSNTPLHNACIADDIQMVRFLLANGADATKRNIFGRSAIEETSNREIVKLFSEYQSFQINKGSESTKETTSTYSPTLFSKPVPQMLSKAVNDIAENCQQKAGNSV